MHVVVLPASPQQVSQGSPLSRCNAVFDTAKARYREFVDDDEQVDQCREQLRLFGPASTPAWSDSDRNLEYSRLTRISHADTNRLVTPPVLDK